MSQLRVNNIIPVSGVPSTGGGGVGSSGGGILQITWKDLGSGNFSQQTTTTSYTASGFTNTITPLSATSKIFHIVSIGFLAICDGQIRIARGGTVVSPSLMDSYRDVSTSNYQYDMPAFTFTYLDSPNTTSACNYELYIRATGCQGFQYIGSPGDFNSSWALMEVSA